MKEVLLTNTSPRLDLFDVFKTSPTGHHLPCKYTATTKSIGYILSKCSRMTQNNIKRGNVAFSGPCVSSSGVWRARIKCDKSPSLRNASRPMFSQVTSTCYHKYHPFMRNLNNICHYLALLLIR